MPTSTEMMVAVIGILHKCLGYVAVCQEKIKYELRKKRARSGSGPGLDLTRP